ncbi:MAG: ATP-binding cassette domain-containing protein, partial [Lachnospiraceae bacterium]|nr:ATP-binding cassette domain-containing protein [Lachnospiraceae bacterium]
PVAEENEEICRVLRAVHMSELADVKCKKLSGGMVRRVGIAQAILGHPKLILFDEPTTGLDIEERCHFYEIFQQLNGICPVLIASHITEDIVEGCTNTIILKNGIVILQEKTKDIKPSLQEVYLSCMHGTSFI